MTESEALRQLTYAAHRMRDNWSDSDQAGKNDLWRDLHEAADAADEVLNERV